MPQNTSKLPLLENGVVVGTKSKYTSENPLKRYLIQAFDDDVAQLAKTVNPDSILEVGCGEGHVARILLTYTKAQICCTDISDTVLDLARTACDSPRISFEKRSIYDLRAPVDCAQLAVCCEVLEHLEEPEKGLNQLAEIASPYCLMSVPREPIFSMLNFCAGANFKTFGNDPAHVQRWSRKSFLDFVASQFEIINVKSPLPWTIVLGRSRRKL